MAKLLTNYVAQFADALGRLVPDHFEQAAGSVYLLDYLSKEAYVRRNIIRRRG
jgi:hypothetical protein